MGHRVEQGSPQLVGGQHRLSPLRFLFEFLSLHGLNDLGGKCPEDHSIVSGLPSIEQHQDRVLSEIDHFASILGVPGAHDPPPRPVTPKFPPRYDGGRLRP